MNTVELQPKADEPEKTTVGALIGNMMTGHCHIAFIGTCGSGPEKSLYLITFSGIVLACDPHRSWCSRSCNVIVDHYCDITITEAGKS